jgi:hypothetical protein
MYFILFIAILALSFGLYKLINLVEQKVFKVKPDGNKSNFDFKPFFNSNKRKESGDENNSNDKKKLIDYANILINKEKDTKTKSILKNEVVDYIKKRRADGYSDDVILKKMKYRYEYK